MALSARVMSCLFERLPPDRWPEITIVPAGTTNMTLIWGWTGSRADFVQNQATSATTR
ncbi:MAG: hypothetical protein P0107_03370 [Nitrosomonas sp.]|nr:hypothetical protein [Nitrosomonas sp.]